MVTPAPRAGGSKQLSTVTDLCVSLKPCQYSCVNSSPELTSHNCLFVDSSRSCVFCTSDFVSSSCFIMEANCSPTLCKSFW